MCHFSRQAQYLKVKCCFSFAGAVLAEAFVSVSMAGAVLREGPVSLFLAGTVLGSRLVSYFAGRTLPGEFWKHGRSLNCFISHH